MQRSLNGTNLTVHIENGTSATTDVSSLKDHDWYEVGGTTQADAITDDIYTQGNVGIGTNTPREKLEIANNPASTGHNLALSTTGENDYWSLMKRPQGYIAPDNFHIGYYDGTNWIQGFDILPNGDMGIGIHTPTSKLDVNGDLRIRNIPAGASTDEILTADANGNVRKVQYLTPPGIVNAFAGTTAPTGYLMCDGSAVSRTTYANLFATIGTTYGAGNGTTTFNLPDLRGEFIRGFDAGRGIDNGRVLGSWQKGSLNVGDDGNGMNTLSLGVGSSYFPSTNGYYSIPTRAYLHTVYPNARDINSNSIWGSGGYYYDVNNSINPTTVGYFGITRPRNISMNYCIKY